MRIGIPKENKVKENRVACTPGGVRMFVQAGHEVLVEKKAGLGSGYEDPEYVEAGARIAPSPEEAWDTDMVLKVKEPMSIEYNYLRQETLLFAYLHLAANRELTEKLVRSHATSIAYETIQKGHRLPLLEPMSEIAGRMSTLMGAYYLSKTEGGNGVLLSGVAGVLPGKVLILGGGTAGCNAARVAIGLGAGVTILEVDYERMRILDQMFQGAAHTRYSNDQNLLGLLPSADITIGGVLLTGAKAPTLITRDMLSQMKPGSVFIDIAIDQGGCAETSRPTTHDNPTYVEENVIHYCVTNMPGAYAHTATEALTNVTLPYAINIANLGFREALNRFPELVGEVNTFEGSITHRAVADAHGLPFTKLAA
jgi:alanine dehydrogenase